MAEQTKSQLTTRAQQVKNEAVQRANSANRVGGLLEDMVENTVHIQEIKITNQSQFGTDIDDNLMLVSPYFPIDTNAVSFNINNIIGSISEPNTSNLLGFAIDENSIRGNKCIVYSKALTIPAILSGENVKFTGDSYSTDVDFINVLTFTYWGDSFIECNNSSFEAFEAPPSTEQNLLLYSQDFANAVWEYQNVNQISLRTDSLGGNTAMDINATSSLTHYVRQVGVPVQPNTTYRLSFGAKGAESANQGIRIAAIQEYVSNPATIIATQTFNYTSQVPAYDQPYQRVIIDFTTGATTENIIVNIIRNSGASGRTWIEFAQLALPDKNYVATTNTRVV